MIILIHVFIIITELRKVTIMSDSIAKYVTVIDGVTFQAFRGDTISRITNRLLTGEAKIEKIDFVIFHVGTNDIGRGAFSRA